MGVRQMSTPAPHPDWVEFVLVGPDQDPLSWYCTACSREHGAQAGRSDEWMGEPTWACPCGAEDAMAWEPWNGQIIDGILVLDSETYDDALRRQSEQDAAVLRRG